nr:retrovirus-related Pol polyprotein from transposon TNT 1-94 [Tanacetum cinerariifolium]
MKIKESLNVTFDETPPLSKTSPLVDDDFDEQEAIKVTEKRNLENDIEDEALEVNEIVNIKESRNNLLENVIGNLNQITLRSQAQNQRTKWMFKNKLDENGIVSRNKARLVAQGYNQQERIDYDETYAPVARLESIRILLAYACALDFKLFQIDVNSAFHKDLINEEKMLKKFGLEDSKPMKTPMSSDTKLIKDEEYESVDSTKYRDMIGLWYPKGTGIETIVYADSDHAGDYVDTKSTSGTKWMFKNKLDENGIVSRNKARLVAQGYNQQERIDYDETYAPVARLESIRILLAYACALDFKLFQIDVNSAFHKDLINEEVYRAQLLGFIDFENLGHVYKLKKALYDLKQAPKAWSYKAVKVKYICFMIQSEPKGSTEVHSIRYSRIPRSTRFYQLSHSEIVDIEKVAVRSSLRLPNNKCISDGVTTSFQRSQDLRSHAQSIKIYT